MLVPKPGPAVSLLRNIVKNSLIKGFTAFSAKQLKVSLQELIKGSNERP